jgi:quinol monooxygenase YgiN
MIFEIARLTIDEAKAAAFEAAVAEAAPLFRRAEGCHHMALERVIEHPGQYHLVVAWESVMHHMEMFRQSPDFQQWRNLVGGFFVTPPVVIHTHRLADFF